MEHTQGRQRSDLEKYVILPSEHIYTCQIEDTVKIEAASLIRYPPITVPKLFERCCRKYGEKPALAFKKEGRWEFISYSEYYQNVRSVSKAFVKLGLKKLHTVSVLGSNDPRWFYSYFAAVMAGGCISGIYPTNTPKACLYCLESTNTKILIIENEEQLQKIQKIRNEIGFVEWIIQYSGQPTDPAVLSWDDFVKMGQKVSDKDLDNKIDSLVVNQACTLLFTSATTGNPKTVMLSHDNMTFMTRIYAELMKAECGRERIMSCFPLNHMMALVTDAYMAMQVGACTYFADKNSLKDMNILNSLRSIKPTIFVSTPRNFEKFHEYIRQNLQNGMFSSIATADLIDEARIKALEYHTSIMNETKKLDSTDRLFHKILNQIKETLGLDQCKIMLNAATHLSSNVRKYLASFDISIGELYGLTECGPHFVFDRYYTDAYSKGKCHPAVKTIIKNPDELGNGEVCISGRTVFMGYLNAPEETSKVIDENAMFHTGDKGCIIDDFIHITGRSKEILITSGGENINPVLIEQNVKDELPMVSHAVLVGDGKKYLSLLISLKCAVDGDTGVSSDILAPETTHWCRSLGYDEVSISKIVEEKPEKIYKAIEEGIRRANLKAISKAQQIQKFLILPRDLAIQTGELGPMMKLKRSSVYDNFKDFIESMYHD